MTKASVLNCLFFWITCLQEDSYCVTWVTLWSGLSLLRDWNLLLTVMWVALKTTSPAPSDDHSPCRHLRATSRDTIMQSIQIHDPQKVCEIPDIYYCKLASFRVICYIVIDNYHKNYLHLNLLSLVHSSIHHTYHPSVATMLKRHLIYKAIPLLLHILSAVSFIFTQNLLLNSTVTLVTWSSVVYIE